MYLALKIVKQIISMVASDLNISVTYENTRINTAEISTQILKFINQSDILTKNLKIYTDGHRDCVGLSLTPTLIHYRTIQKLKFEGYDKQENLVFSRINTES